MAKQTKKPKNLWEKFLALHEHKKYLEFFTALLSIPVLLTVIILNLNSVKNLNNAKPTETPQQGGFFSAPIPKAEVTDTETAPVSGTQVPCKEELGPISIDAPEENETVTDNPVSVIINYDDEEYCGAVWAYRINGGKWSEYDDKSIALYNLPQGKIKFELKAKSLVKKGEKTITRNFTYKGDTTVTNAPTMAQDELGTSDTAPTPGN